MDSANKVLMKNEKLGAVANANGRLAAHRNIKIKLSSITLYV